MIAFRKSPLATGVMKCWKCWRDFPLDAFEPMTGGRYGLRRTCRRCRQPVYQRYERKRRERKAVAFENRIATVPAGPEFDTLARNVLSGQQLRFIRALACRLKAGTYERDAEGQPIIPTTFKPWADRLNLHQADAFCRRKLGLPRLPARRRSPYPTAAELIRASLKRHRTAGQLRQQQRPIEPQHDAPWPEDDLWPPDLDERSTPDVESGTGQRWTIEDERRYKAQLERDARSDESCDEPPDYQSPGRTREEIYFEMVMAVPPPAPLPVEPEPQPRRPPMSEGATGNNPFPPWLPNN